MSDDRLDALRERILALDEQILELVHQRVETAQEIGRIKTERGEPLQNFTVEKNVLEHALAAAKERGVDAETTQRLVEAMIRASLKEQERARIAAGRTTDGRMALVVGGAGLMGGWFARFLSEKGYTVHVLDPQPSRWPTGDPAQHAYDVVVLATPPSVLPRVLDEVVAAVPKAALVFDIASIKGGAKESLRKLAAEGRHVTSLHPMFGPQTELLMGHNVVLLDCGRPDAVAAADRLFADTTAARRTLPLGEHDARMAEVLGLAHATSLVFSRTLADGPYGHEDLEPLASTTFQKQVAVSREVARENPRLYYEIQALNPHNQAVLDRFAQALDALRALVADEDADAFEAYMRAGREWYDPEGPP